MLLALAMQVQAQCREVDLVILRAGMKHHIQGQRRAGCGALQLGGLQREGVDIHVGAGAKTAACAIYRCGVHLRALDDGVPLRDGIDDGFELHHRHGGQRAQVMGPQQLNQIVGEFGQLIIELLADPPAEKGESLQQPFHVGIAGPCGQKRRQFGIGL